MMMLVQRLKMPVDPLESGHRLAVAGQLGSGVRVSANF